MGAALHEMISEASREAWALLPDSFPALAAYLSGKRSVGADRGKGGPSKKGGRVAVLPVEGIISKNGWFGASTVRISQFLRQLASDDGIRAIVLEVDSPGGAVSGVEELAREIHQAKAKKPIVAVANSLAASAAYWLASQASEVVVTPTGQVGSIGVYSIHVDVSRALDKEGVAVSLIHAGRYKVEGHPFEPLGAEARAEMQSKVDGFYRMFTSAVRRGRGSISEDVMQGRMYSAEQALKHGLADRVETLGETLSRLWAG